MSNEKEILVLTQIQYYSLFSFLTLNGVLFGSLRTTQDINKEIIVGFVLSQIAFVVIMLSFVVTATIVALASYARIIEEKTNTILGENVSIWESEITRRYLFRPISGFYFSQTVLWLTYSFFFTVIIIGCYHLTDKELNILSFHINKLSILWFQVGELVLCIVAAFLSSQGSDKVQVLFKHDFLKTRQ